MSALCVLPFLQFDNEMDGSCRPCCLNAASFGNTRRDSILDVWNSEGWRELRREFYTGGRPASCRTCWAQEEMGLTSFRQQNTVWHGPGLDLSPGAFEPQTGRMLLHPRSLALKASSLCNLACRMCSPHISTSVNRVWDADLTALTGQQRARLNVNFPDLQSALSEVRTIGPSLRAISFGGGEPLLDPAVREMVIALHPWAPRIRSHANTNLSYLQHGGLDTLALMARFRCRLVTLSVDGPPSLQRYIRAGLDVPRFLENLEQLRQLPGVGIDSNTSVQILNALHLPETLDFVLRVVRPQTLLTSFATGAGSEHLDVRFLAPELKRLLHQRLAAFLESARPEEYPAAPAQAVAHARAVAADVDRFAHSADLWTPEQWTRTSAFLRKLDAVHGTELATVSPLLASHLAPEVSPALSTQNTASRAVSAERPKDERIDHADPESRRTFIVNWCLAGVCNYACSYCPPALHDHKIRFPPAETVVAAFRQIRAQRPDHRIAFELTGGEVTAWPEFLECASQLKREGALLSILSNGSRPVSWWEKAVPHLDKVILSYHSESAEFSRFFEVASYLRHHVSLHVNVIMHPRLFQQCLAAAQILSHLSELTVAMQPVLQDLSRPESPMVSYTREQLECVQQSSTLLRSPVIARARESLRGPIVVEDAEGHRTVRTPQELLSAGANRWRGWTCWIGLQQIAVEIDGAVFRGYCRQGPRLGNLREGRLALPSAPITCASDRCTCYYDIQCTKVRSAPP